MKFIRPTWLKVLFVSAMLMIIFTSLYMGLFGGWQSISGYLFNPDGKIPLSDNLQKYAPYSPNAANNDFSGGGIVLVSDSPEGTGGLSTGLCCSGKRLNGELSDCKGTYPCLDVDGKRYPIIVGGGNGDTGVTILKDLRGKNAQMTAYSFGQQLIGSCNCGSSEQPGTSGNPSGRTGTMEVRSSLLDDSKYICVYNGGLICDGTLKPGEKLSMSLTTVVSRYGGVGSAQSTYNLLWTFPYICTPSANMDLAEQTFHAGETVTLTGMRRWPTGLCNELAPILINQSATSTAGGVNRVPELLDRLAQPPKDDPSTPQDESLYVVPLDSLLKVQFWIAKDASLPTPCYDPVLQGGFNLNKLECDKNINLRTFCSGNYVNGECITSTNLKIDFNCPGGMDQTQNPPVCKLGSANRNNQLAFCIPGDGTAINPQATCLDGTSPANRTCSDGSSFSSKCANPIKRLYYEPYTNFQDACNAGKGIINTNNPDECITPTVSIKLVPKDPNTPVNSLAVGTFNSNTGGISAGGLSGQCEVRLPDGSCATKTTLNSGNGFIRGWMETIHEWPYYGNTKNKHALFFISLFIIALTTLQFIGRWFWSKVTGNRNI